MRRSFSRATDTPPRAPGSVDRRTRVRRLATQSVAARPSAELRATRVGSTTAGAANLTRCGMRFKAGVVRPKSAAVADRVSEPR